MKRDYIPLALSELIYKFGLFVAKHPWPFLIIPPIISISLSAGFFVMRTTSDFEYLYTPVKAPARRERALVERLFPMNDTQEFTATRITRIEGFAQVIIQQKNEHNILKNSYLDAIFEIDQLIRNMAVHHKGKELRYADVCAARQGQCAGSSFLRLMVNQSINDVTLKFPEHITGYSKIYLPHELGGVKTDTNDVITSAKAVMLSYFVRYQTDKDRACSKKWLIKFPEKLLNFKSSKVKLEAQTSLSLELEFEESVKEVMGLFALTFTIMSIFSVLSTMMLDWVRAKPWVALGGLFAAGMSSVSSLGLLTACGVPFTSPVAIVPFLIIGVGLDDMYIMVASWRCTSYTLPTEERIGRSMKNAAVSITITSATDALAFGVGITSPFRSIQLFCAYAMAGIIFCYFYQLTFTLSCMTFSGRRESANRHCLTFRKVLPKSESQGESRFYRWFCAGGSSAGNTGDSYAAEAEDKDIRRNSSHVIHRTHANSSPGVNSTRVNSLSNAMPRTNSDSSDIGDMPRINSLSSGVPRINSVSTDMTYVDSDSTDMSRVNSLSNDMGLFNVPSSNSTPVDSFSNDMTHESAAQNGTARVYSETNDYQSENWMSNDVANREQPLNDESHVNSVPRDITRLDSLPSDTQNHTSNVISRPNDMAAIISPSNDMTSNNPSSNVFIRTNSMPDNVISMNYHAHDFRSKYGISKGHPSFSSSSQTSRFSASSTDNMIPKELRHWRKYATKQPSETKEGEDNIQLPWLSEFLSTKFATFLIKIPVRLFFVLIYIIYLAISIYGILRLKHGLDLRNLVPDDSYFANFSRVYDVHFGHDYGPIVQIIYNEKVDYSRKSRRNEIDFIKESFQRNKYFYGKREFYFSWLSDFEIYLSLTGRDVEEMEQSEFISILKNEFLSIPGLDEYRSDIIFNKNETAIIASRMFIQCKGFKEIWEESAMMVASRTITDGSKFDALSFNSRFIAYEQFLVVVEITLQGLAIAVASMFVVSLIFIPSITTVLLITLTTVSIEVGVIGFMSLWGVSLDTVSMVNLIMCIGFSVDFAAHISYHYVASKNEDSVQNTKDALGHLGAPIVQAALSSVIAVSVLSISKSYVFRTFFKVVTLIMVFGFFHAMFLLPVFLSSFQGLRQRMRKQRIEPEQIVNSSELVPSENVPQDKNINMKTEPYSKSGRYMEDKPYKVSIILR